MKKDKKSWLASILLAASVAMLAVPASAAITYTAGDLVLAVRATAGTGSTQTYLVDIGNASLFQNATGTINVNTLSSLGNVGADLTAVFGTGGGSATEWYNRSDLSWSVFGSDGNADLWASRQQTTLGTNAALYSSLTPTARSITDSAIQSVTSTFANSTHTANSAGYFQANANTAASYNYQVTSGSTAFGTTSTWTTSRLEGNFANGTAGTALNLFQYVANAPTNLGVFTINNSGVLSFTSSVSAVPEPSRVLFGMLGLAAVFLRRRRAAVCN